MPLPKDPSSIQLSKLSLLQVLLLILLQVSNVTCRPSSGLDEDRLGSVLDLLWPLESDEKLQGNVGDHAVSVEDVEKNEKVLKREVVNQISEDQVIRRPVVRLGSDNLPYVFYADNEVVKVAKVVRKMRVRKRKRKKKVVSAPPLDIRDRSQRRRPKLVLMNSEGQAMPPVLMHLNDRIAPVYSFKSRSGRNGNKMYFSLTMTATVSDYNKQVVTISLIKMASEFSPFVALQRTYIIFTGRHKFFSAFKTLLSYKILYGKQRQTKNPFLFQIPKTSASKRHQLGGRRTGPIDSLVLCSLIRDTLHLGILRYGVKKNSRSPRILSVPA